MAATFAWTQSRFPKATLNFILTCLVAVAVFLPAAASHAANDTARFYGTWQAHILVNGKIITVISIHDANGYRNFVRTSTGDSPAGDGTFSAANGFYRTNAPNPNNGGVYYFSNNNTAVCTNLAGQIVTWRRIKSATDAPPAQSQYQPRDANQDAQNASGYAPPSSRPGTEHLNPGGPAPGTHPAAGGAGFTPDPSLSPQVNAAMAALTKGDSVTAWRDFTALAQSGDSYGEFGLGAMLFRHLNPPGTGYYAQCEKWLLASANHGNIKGMEFLGRYYYEVGVAVAGGINPGINNAPIPPALRAQAEEKFRRSRQWFERASEQGDVYAMGNLALMLDAGVGGPPDAARAAQLREQVKAGADKTFARKATADPSNLAMNAAWQSGHYADAIRNAQAAAQKGDANAEALLGRAYYEGVGVPRHFSTALFWLNKAEAQGNADGMFFLGLMYEFGAGVDQNLNKALNLFDRAAAKGQGYARMEAKGMRMQGESDRIAAQARRNGSVLDTACETAGGVPTPGACIRGGSNIDPFNGQQAGSPY